jgi:hypothetical protein
VSPIEACRGCGGIYSYLPRGLCAECLDRREAAFQTVKEWLHENPGASVARVSLETEVAESLIAEFIREGRLVRIAAGPAPDDLREEQERRARIMRQMTPGSAHAAPEAQQEPSPSGMKARRP